MEIEPTRMLLVEDEPHDVEFILLALDTYNVVNQFDRVEYGVKPLDFAQFLDVARQVGLYWMILNKPP